MDGVANRDTEEETEGRKKLPTEVKGLPKKEGKPEKKKGGRMQMVKKDWEDEA